jgi:hypothetical protein
VNSRRQLALLWGGVALVCLAALPLAAQLAPSLAACPIKSHTGWPCPSCGATRAILAFSEFDLLGALALNPMVVVSSLGFVGAGLGAAVWALLGGSMPALPKQLPVSVRVGATLMLVLNWLYLVASGV